MEHHLLWILGALFLSIAAFCIVGNVVVLIRYLLKRKRSSIVPLIGGLAGMLGMLIIPIRGSGKWFWLPLVLDYGAVPMVTGALWTLVRSCQE
jgi:hypothetical protein